MHSIQNPPRHIYWGAGEPDCPKNIKASNGELHTLKCKVCGLENPKDNRCHAQVSTKPNLPDPNTLNPNNPVVRAAAGQWHQICALIMHKLGVKHVEITDADIATFPPGSNVGIADDKGHIEVFLLNARETQEALKKHGGTPGQS